MGRSKSGSVQLAAAQALVTLGDEQGQKHLEAELDSPSEQSRLRAASLLCDRGVWWNSFHGRGSPTCCSFHFAPLLCWCLLK